MLFSHFVTKESDRIVVYQNLEDGNKTAIYRFKKLSEARNFCNVQTKVIREKYGKKHIISCVEDINL